MRRLRTFCNAFAILAFGTLALPGPAAAAVGRTWDAAAVAGVAAQLVEAADGLRGALRDQPDLGMGNAARHRLRDQLRLLGSEARHLEAIARKGRGRAATFPVFERLQELHHDAAEMARFLDLGPALAADLARTGSVLADLAPYYRATASESAGR